jgi:uncharacterized protein with gpF-like domain
VELLAKSVELGYDAQLKLIFAPKAREAVAAVGSKTADGRRTLLEARGLSSFASISKTTTENVVSEVMAGMNAGNTLAQIAQGIAEKFSALNFNRAKTIARTETLTAVSIGQGGAIKAANKVIPGMKKVWLTAQDDRVRDSHKELDGDVIGGNEKFKSGLGNELQFPRDPRTNDAADVINCRCTVAMVAPEDLDQLDL